MSRRIRVAINGFGRIGRTVLRAWMGGTWPEIEIVAINDIASADDCAYLLEFDSVFGRFPGEVVLEHGRLIAGGHVMRLTREADLSRLDLSDIDIVMECTGRADSIEVSGRGIAAGAGRVLVSGPSEAAEFTVVLGANDAQLDASMHVVSNASCTTNALAPLVKVLDEAFGVENGWMTTIHCYTGSQPTVDAPRGNPARSRAAALSMVPTTTSAGRLLDRVLPDLAGRVACAAVRVPVASVSAIDLTFHPARAPDLDEVTRVLRQAGGVIGWTDRPLVSSDLRARPESIVMALPETHVSEVGDSFVRVFGWYDNEWGFSCRMLDVARLWGQRVMAPERVQGLNPRVLARNWFLFPHVRRYGDGEDQPLPVPAAGSCRRRQDRLAFAPRSGADHDHGLRADDADRDLLLPGGFGHQPGPPQRPVAVRLSRRA